VQHRPLLVGSVGEVSATTGEAVLGPLVAAWSQCCDQVLELGRSLSEDEAARPTDLPGWSVADVFAHLAALESELAGQAPAPVDDAALPPDALDNPFRAHTERGVAARRRRPLAEVLDELATAVRWRRDALESEPLPDPGARTSGIGGADWTWETLLRNRVVDVWMHEQDVRRAVGRPGGWDTPAAQVTIGGFAAALGFVLGRQVRPPLGTSVRWRVGGAAHIDQTAGFEVTLVMQEDGRARPPAQADLPADAELLMTLEQFVLACGGRRPADQLAVAVTGDTELGRRVVAAMAITP
jgi:uncharacterized protein (TIGR03083 family)